MLRVHPQHVCQCLLPVLQCLAGQAVHQVQRDIPESRLADALEGGHRLGVGMGAAQLFQHVVVVVLDAQAHPVEALRPHPVEKLVGDGIGVGLEGDLRVHGHVKISPDGGHDDGNGVPAEVAGGAAAEVDGVHPVAGGQGAGLLDVGAHGVQIAVHQAVVLAGQGVEITVLAFALAEGNVDINAQGCFIQSSGKNRHDQFSLR